MSHLVLILVLFLSPLLYAGFGALLTALLSSARALKTANPLTLAETAFVGLIVSTALSFFLFHFGVPLPLAACIPWLLGVWGLLKERSLLIELCTEARRKTDVRAMLYLVGWICLIAVIGSSIFSVSSQNEIQTVWISNYGDIAFHLGIISSFVFGTNTVPEYHIFAGEVLTYPFFINFWSSTFWWTSTNFQALKIIFAYQFAICWLFTFLFLKGNRFPLLSLSLLFGGGSYLHLGERAAALIEKGQPWTPFLSTLWVPQRGFMWGVPGVILAVQLFHASLNELAGSERQKDKMFLSGLVFAFLPLIHMHSFIVGVFYCGLVLAVEFVKNRTTLTLIGYFGRGILPCLIFAPWIIGKESMLVFISGWVTGEFTQPRWLAALKVWATPSTSFFIIFLIGALFFRDRKLSGAILLFLFCLGQKVQFASWDWDQTKYFIVLGVIALKVWQETLLVSTKWRYTELFAVVLMIPSIYETVQLMRVRENYTVYSAWDLQVAERVRKHTDPSSIIACAPDYNSPITLTGRKMFYGYEGTLSSHSINYTERKGLMERTIAKGECRLSHDNRRCPSHLLWTEREQQYFHHDIPVGVISTNDPLLYEMPSIKLKEAVVIP